MDLFVAPLAVAALLVTLVAGFLVAFALIAMPGLGRLADREFIRAFQEMDGIIQRRHPVFMFLWVGSVVALVGAAILNFSRLDGVGRSLLGVAVALYVFGVQLPTARINIPLNNEIQSVNADQLDSGALRQAREAFEPRWNRWNVRRTVVACTTSALLIALLGWL